jgi:hypothetical protein
MLGSGTSDYENEMIALRGYNSVKGARPVDWHTRHQELSTSPFNVIFYFRPKNITQLIIMKFQYFTSAIFGFTAAAPV